MAVRVGRTDDYAARCAKLLGPGDDSRYDAAFPGVPQAVERLLGR